MGNYGLLIGVCLLGVVVPSRPLKGHSSFRLSSRWLLPLLHLWFDSWPETLLKTVEDGWRDRKQTHIKSEIKTPENKKICAMI
jgi:hypothetical protein